MFIEQLIYKCFKIRIPRYIILGFLLLNKFFFTEAEETVEYRYGNSSILCNQRITSKEKEEKIHSSKELKDVHENTGILLDNTYELNTYIESKPSYSTNIKVNNQEVGKKRPGMTIQEDSFFDYDLLSKVMKTNDMFDNSYKIELKNQIACDELVNSPFPFFEPASNPGCSTEGSNEDSDMNCVDPYSFDPMNIKINEQNNMNVPIKQQEMIDSPLEFVEPSISELYTSEPSISELYTSEPSISELHTSEPSISELHTSEPTNQAYIFENNLELLKKIGGKIVETEVCLKKKESAILTEYLNREKFLYFVKKIVNIPHYFEKGENMNLAFQMNQVIRVLQNNRNEINIIEFFSGKGESRRLLNFLFRNSNYFKEISECKNTFEIIESYDFIHLFFSIFYLFKDKRFINDRVHIRKKIQRKSGILNEFSTDRNSFEYYISRYAYACSKFYISESGEELKSMCEVLQKVLSINEKIDQVKKEDFEKYMKHLYEIIKTIKMKCNHMRSSLLEWIKMDAEELTSLNNKFSEDIGICVEFFSSNLNVIIMNTQKLIKEFCKDDCILGKLLYHSFGFVVLKKLLIKEKNPTENALIVISLEKVFNQLQYILGTSNNNSDFMNNKKEDEEFPSCLREYESTLLYLLAMNSQFIMLRALIEQLNVYLNHVSRIIDKIVKNIDSPRLFVEIYTVSSKVKKSESNIKSNNQKFRSQYYAKEAMGVIDLAMKILTIFLNSQKQVEKFLSYFNLCNDINANTRILRATTKIIANNTSDEIRKENGYVMYKNILQQYKELSEIASHLFDLI